jgi:hypothetical protein
MPRPCQNVISETCSTGVSTLFHNNMITLPKRKIAIGARRIKSKINFAQRVLFII